MMTSFSLPSVDEVGKQESQHNRIRLAHWELVRYLEGRMAVHPTIVRPNRIPAIAQLLGHAAFWMTPADREALANLGLVICAVDDLVDESEIPTVALEHLIEQLVACCCGEHCAELAFDPTATLLRDLVGQLQRAPLATALWSDWTQAISACLRGIVTHRRAAEALAAGQALSLDQYLAFSGDSMGVMACSMMAAIVAGDPAVLACKAHFLSAAVHAATATRLANDLRTAERERTEGTINALFLPSSDPISLALRSSAEWAAATRILVALPDRGGRVGRFVIDFAGGLLELYRRCDFHDCPQS